MTRLLLTALVLLPFGSLAADDFKVGFAEVDITPPVGYRMCGYFNERPSTGVHDPLWAKAVVLEQGQTTGAIVICDLIGPSEEITHKARAAASKQTGIPKKNICIAATHSHTGPLFGGALRELFHRRAVEMHGHDPLEKVDYPEFLAEKLVEAITAAQKNAKPATMSAGIGEETKLSFNRRFHMKDGSVVFNPGRLNPNMVRPAGPIDPDVGLVKFADQGGAPLGLLTVFALHLDTTGGTEYSADYPYYLQETLRAKLSDSFHSLFGAGTCGDINHIDFYAEKQGVPGKSEAERIGTALGQNVLATLDKIAPIEPKLQVRHTAIEVPKQSYDEDAIAEARKRIEKVGTRDLTFLEQVEATKIVDLQLRPGDTITLEVQVFQLSDDTAIVCLPGEVFVDLGLAIKAASPYKHTLVMELCNDTPAYIPTRKAFAEGSYETVNSRAVPGSGEKMVEAAIELLRK